MPRTALFCVPFAGAGSAFFSDWQEHTTQMEVVPLQLPGREKRFAEDPYRDVADAADGLLPEALERAMEDRPVALFGHSLGAVIAFELARRLASVRGPGVARLLVSGSPGPWTPRSRRATGLPDHEFLQRVQEFAGYSHPTLEHPEMRALLLPTLRADVEMHENYVPTDHSALPVPITAIRGTADELVRAEQAWEWSKATTRDFRLVEVEGGHMYLAGSAALVVATLESELGYRDEGGTSCD
jgi:surfactin synthase thioesterase subunit